MCKARSCFFPLKVICTIESDERIFVHFWNCLTSPLYLRVTSKNRQNGNSEPLISMHYCNTRIMCYVITLGSCELLIASFDLTDLRIRNAKKTRMSDVYWNNSGKHAWKGEWLLSGFSLVSLCILVGDNWR